jgi:hypothetical protein
VTHLVEDGADRHGALREVRLVDHLDLATAGAFDTQEPGREGGERFVQRLGTGWQRAGAVAAPVAAPRGHSAHPNGRSLPVALRTNSTHSASAASPRRWRSSGVMSGTSAFRFPRLRTLTIADFAAGGAGAAGASSLAGGGAAGSCSSSTGGMSAGARRLALVTIAGQAIATAFRFRGDRFGRWV